MTETEAASSSFWVSGEITSQTGVASRVERRDMRVGVGVGWVCPGYQRWGINHWKVGR